MQNITLGVLVHEAADRQVAEEEARKLMANVIKRRPLKNEVFLVAHTVGGAMAAKALRGRQSEGDSFSLCFRRNLIFF